LGLVFIDDLFPIREQFFLALSHDSISALKTGEKLICTVLIGGFLKMGNER